ncbi:hypothetical protein, partial [Acinetobacter baumannii]|uniref:hypothetical protein n=1 Tax=Acinetobacter baumannii TaxID=470 RepID=UPI001BB4662C
ADLAPYYDRACAYAQCGQPVFREPVDGVETADTAFDFTRLERFSNQPKFQVAHGAALKTEPRIDLRLNATVVDARFDAAGRIQALVV